MLKIPKWVEKLRKRRRNKVAKSSDQQKTKDSVKSEQCMSRTNEDKKSNQKRKSKRNKGEMKNSKVCEKLDVPVKSEKCSKISKSNVVKSGTSHSLVSGNGETT